MLAPLVALALFMGVASPLFTRLIEPSAHALVRTRARARASGRGSPRRRPSSPARAEADRGR